ncbi:MAG: hypothetical protein K2L22_06540 [Muribaculaceae bacterium]|nr:hypothetical protein [Muribaculaceae bacterium]
MRSKKIRFTLLGLTLLSSLCLSFSSMHAENEQPQRSTVLEKTETGFKPIRPKTPDRQIVTCVYDGEELHLSFVLQEGNATLSLTDDSLVTVTYEIDTRPLDISVSVGSLYGPTSIEVSTEKGNSYTGTIE